MSDIKLTASDDILPVMCTSCELPKQSVDSNCINGFPLAMAYVPMQKFQKLYSPEKGLENGTLFEELNLPFCGGAR